MRELPVGQREIRVRTGWVRRTLVGRVETGYGAQQGESGMLRRYASKLPVVGVAERKTSDITVDVTAVVLGDASKKRGRDVIPLWTYPVTVLRSGESVSGYRRRITDRQESAKLDVIKYRDEALKLLAAGVDKDQIGATIRQEIDAKVAARRLRKAAKTQ